MHYKSLSLNEKAATIAEVKKGVKSKSLIAKEYEIPASTLSTFLKNEKEILDSVNPKNNSTVRKRLRKKKAQRSTSAYFDGLKNSEVNAYLYLRFWLQQKQENLQQLLGLSDFKASSGWLDFSKKDNDIVFKTVSGESESVNLEKAEDSKVLLSDMISDRNPKDIFNVDELGLFFNVDKSFSPPTKA